MTSDCVVLPRKTQWPAQLVLQTTHRGGIFALFAGPEAVLQRHSTALDGLLRASAGRCLPGIHRLTRELGSSLWPRAVLDSRRSSDGTALLNPFTDLSSTCPSPGEGQVLERSVKGFKDRKSTRL